MSIELVVLVLGSAFLGVTWDGIRRLTDRRSRDELAQQVATLESRVGELEDLPEQVADIGKRVVGISNGVESLKSTGRRPGTFRIG
jgi:hypothetical protein